METPEDLTFQERSWRWEGRGQRLVALIVVLGAVGLFGEGPLTQGQAETPTGLQVEYPRWARNQSTYPLKIAVPTTAVRDGVIRLWVDQQLFDALSIEQIYPEPRRMQLGAERLWLEFDAEQTTSLMPIQFQMKPERFGRREVRLGLGESDQLAVSTFIYP